MNTIQLECFLMVADCLNFTKAAESLKITQPAVSHQIRALEDELGVKLFIRTNKRVSLTKEGMQFIEDALSILKIANASKFRLSKKLSSQPIPLGIGCHSTWELSLLPPLIEQLSQEFAQFIPVLKLIPLPVMENLLEDESIQVMFSFRTEQEQGRHAKYMELIHCPIVCVCAPGHPFAKRKSLTQEELHTGGKFALCSPRQCDPSFFRVQSKLSSEHAATELIFEEGYEVIQALIKANFAFTVWPDIPISRDPALCYIPISGLPSLSFGISYASGEASPLLKRFLEIAKLHFDIDKKKSGRPLSV